MKKCKTGGMKNPNKNVTASTKATGRSGGTNANVKVNPSAKKGGSSKKK